MDSKNLRHFGNRNAWFCIASKELRICCICADIEKYTTFYPAEENHQNYKSKNPYRYKFYRWNCGRDKKLREIWDEKH